MQFGMFIFVTCITDATLVQKNTMKANYWITVCLFSMFTISAVAQRSLEVTITNIPSQEGTVRVALFEGEEQFLKKPVKTLTADVTGNSVTLLFESVSCETCAISVFHDENNNAKMDTNFMGIPTESYGFSNNARGRFGPPAFQDAKLSLKEGKNSISIAVK
jgi:uncharacterized protein (DUF2141 family)